MSGTIHLPITFIDQERQTQYLGVSSPSALVASTPLIYFIPTNYTSNYNDVPNISGRFMEIKTVIQ